MFHGILALVGRSLRVDSRSWQPHLARLGLMAGIYIALCVSLWTAMWFGAPGLRFFRGIAYLNLAFMTLMGISFFSTPVSEEKEEDLLGLMLMAGISPLGILIGKSGGRLIQALLLVAVQYPFTLLAVTMGGVTQDQVAAVYLALVGYLVLLGGFGLLCSTIASNNRIAAGLMTSGLSLYLLVPLVASNFRSFIVSTGQTMTGPAQFIVDRVIATSVFQQMGAVLTTGSGESIWSWQVISNLTIGIVSFGLAWACFGLASRQPAGEAATRGLIGRTNRHWFSAGRPWSNPFVWKDFYFTSGGLAMIPIRLAFCGALFLFATFQSNMDISFFQVFMSLAVAIEAGRVMSRALHDEVRNQTLASLIMLPRTTVFLVYSKLAGALLGWLPCPLVDLFVTVCTKEGRHNFEWVVGNSLGICIASFFVLIPHFSALLSLYLRWGAVPLGTATAIGIHVAVLTALQPASPKSFAFVFVAMLMYGICIACHVAIIFRVRQLAASR